MSPRLFHIYGPIWIHSFGLMIMLGFFLFMYLTYVHPVRRRYLSAETYSNMLLWGAVSLYVGGRLFIVVTEWDAFKDNLFEIFYPWVGGFGILGAIITCVLTMVWFFKKNGLPVLPMFDLITLYTPLFQAISRLGCFFAGCCYGTVAPDLWCAVTYIDQDSLAPLHVPLHPSQLYSSLASLSIFMILRYGVYPRGKQGRTLWWYLALESIARFIVEFWRGDNQITAYFFSKAQLIALALFLVAVIGSLWTHVSQKSESNVSV